MNRSRLLLALVIGCCLLRPSTLRAADSPPPFEMEKYYSANVDVTTKEGMHIDSVTYVDGDKMRSDFSTNGMQMAIIVRRDKQKIYQLMAAQKMAMELPFDPAKLKAEMGTSFAPEGNFDLIGTESIDGIACSKYKVTPDQSGRTYICWLDLAHKVPVQMTDAAGSFVVKWSNFKPGPQDDSLFEVPADFTILPSGPTPVAPGGAPNGQGPGGP